MLVSVGTALVQVEAGTNHALNVLAHLLVKHLAVFTSLKH